MGSLSVCCLTRDPPHRVATILEALRTAAREIVVAADASSDVAAASEVAAVADRIVEIEYEPPPERYAAWLHSLCRGDWILRIDGDETPSQSLVDALPTLVEARDVVQYRLPRRWLFGEVGYWLDELPWWPDYQLRLVRNDPATLRFPGTVHSSVEPAWPARYLETPIYHLVLLTSSREERIRRVALYEQLPLSQGHVVPNYDFYVPESRERHSVRPVPAEDAGLIRSALTDSSPRPAPTVRRSVERVPRQEVERTWALREIPPEAYDVSLTPLTTDVKLEPRAERFIPIRIDNHGSERLSWGEFEPRIRLGYRWLDGPSAGAEGPRTLLSADLAPGASAVEPLRVIAPREPGHSRLEVDLVHEGVRWFGASAEIAVAVGTNSVAQRRP